MITSALKEIMHTVDLDEVTSKDVSARRRSRTYAYALAQIRQQLEERLQLSLSDYKEFVDHEMLIILGHMEKPSQIFDHLFLGTEWNASNLEQLHDNRCGRRSVVRAHTSRVAQNRLHCQRHQGGGQLLSVTVHIHENSCVGRRKCRTVKTLGGHIPTDTTGRVSGTRTRSTHRMLQIGGCERVDALQEGHLTIGEQCHCVRNESVQLVTRHSTELRQGQTTMHHAE
jgi:hypothetical protein